MSYGVPGSNHQYRESAPTESRPVRPRPPASNGSRPPASNGSRPPTSNTPRRRPKPNGPRRSRKLRRRKKCLKIPYTYVRLILPMLLTFMITFAFAIYQLNQNHITMQQSEAELYELLGEYSILEQEAGQLQSMLDSIEQRYNVSQVFRTIQADRLNEQDIRFLDELNELERLANEIEYRMNSIVERRGAIQDQLESIPFLPNFSSHPITEMMPVAYSSDPVQQLRNRLDALSEFTYAELNAFQELEQSVTEVRPLLANYPSIWPVRGRVSSGFGWRQRPMGGGTQEHHTGLDIAVPRNTEIVATGGGVVRRASYAGAYGNLVVIYHGMGMETYYAHNQRLLVSVGDRVERGQVIALSGSTGFSTGPHLHYEVRINNVPVNPLHYVTLSD